MVFRCRKMAEEEEEYKITVSLSRKGLKTLDMLKETSGFGSRGRTIEEAILTISELTASSQSVFGQYLSDMKSGGTVSNQTGYSIIGWFVIAIAKISRFISLPAEQLAQRQRVDNSLSSVATDA